MKQLNNQVFKSKIENLLFKKKITKEAFANAIGINRVTLQDEINGKTQLKVNTLLAISEFFEVALTDLIRADEEEAILIGRMFSEIEKIEDIQKAKTITKIVKSLNLLPKEKATTILGIVQGFIKEERSAE